MLNGGGAPPVNVVGFVGRPRLVDREGGHTLTQQSAISSTMFSNRAHNAAVHWGAVKVVGSVLTRDLYDVGEGGKLGAASVELQVNTVLWRRRA